MNTPALISTPPESARMGHAHSPETWTKAERARRQPLGKAWRHIGDEYD